MRSKIHSIFTSISMSLFFLPNLALGLMERPIVGILSHPTLHSESPATPQYHIAASYVKWVESGGAVSIPIPYDADETLVREIFGQINGVLFPGGNADLPPSAKWIWNLALENNQRGEYFPVWGTCLGFEFLVTLTGGDNLLDTCFKAENVSFPLVFPTKEDVINSNGVFSSESQLYPSQNLRDTLSTHNITMNNHHKGITPENFLMNEALSSSFHITSTNVDLQGRPFVSTIESILYPIYGVQYHPEKNNFEYGMHPNNTTPDEAISHTEEAVHLSMHLAMFFVNRTRRSSIGKYTLPGRHPAITSYPVITGTYFEQLYIIPGAEHWTRVGESSDISQQLRGRSSIV